MQLSLDYFDAQEKHKNLMILRQVLEFKRAPFFCDFRED